MVFLLVAGLVWLAGRPASLLQLFRRPYVIILTAYVALTVILALVHAKQNGVDATAAGLAMNLRYLLAAVLAAIVFRHSSLSEKWFSRATEYLIIIGVVVSVFGILQVLVLPTDFLAHFGYSAKTIEPSVVIDSNPHLLRAFATLRGPNDFGAFLILPMILVVSQLKKRPIYYSAALFGIMLWALIVSGSRSAWIGLIVALVAYLVLHFGKKIDTKKLIVFGLGVVASCLVIFYAALHISSVRLAVFHSSPGDTSLTEGSTDNHFSATRAGIKRVAEQPLGCGPGCAGPASYYSESPKISENYFVQIAEETGILGLGLFVALVLMVAWQLSRDAYLRHLSLALLASLIGYGAIGMLLHVWTDDPLAITWWILAGAVIGYNESKSWTK